MGKAKVDKAAEQGAPVLKCVACEKSQYEVRVLIAIRDDVAICDDCILLCLDVLMQRFRELAKADGHERVRLARRTVTLAREMVELT